MIKRRTLIISLSLPFTHTFICDSDDDDGVPFPFVINNIEVLIAFFCGWTEKERPTPFMFYYIFLFSCCFGAVPSFWSSSSSSELSVVVGKRIYMWKGVMVERPSFFVCIFLSPYTISISRRIRNSTTISFYFYFILFFFFVGCRC